MSERLTPGGVFLVETSSMQAMLPDGTFVNDTFGSNAFSFSAEFGRFLLTGQAVTLTESAAKVLLAETATPFIVGQGASAQLFAGLTMPAAAGSFDLSVAPSLSDHENDSDKATFTLTAPTTSLVKGVKLIAGVGQYIVKMQGVVASLALDVGTFALTGNAATFNVGHTMTSERGTFTHTGRAAVLNADDDATTWTAVEETPFTTWTQLDP